MTMNKKESKSLRECYYKMCHKSGLNVYVFPKKLTVSYALFGTKYGSVDNCFQVGESDKMLSVPNGIAHYLEHRMLRKKTEVTLQNASRNMAQTQTPIHRSTKLFICLAVLKILISLWGRCWIL